MAIRVLCEQALLLPNRQADQSIRPLLFCFQGIDKYNQLCVFGICRTSIIKIFKKLLLGACCLILFHCVVFPFETRAIVSYCICVSLRLAGVVENGHNTFSNWALCCLTNHSSVFHLVILCLPFIFDHFHSDQVQFCGGWAVPSGDVDDALLTRRQKMG